MKDEYNFQVLENVERLPGVYMYKHGELVPYDGSDVSEVVIQERWTVRKLTPPQEQKD